MMIEQVKNIVIICDYREERCGIPRSLLKQGVDVRMETLIAGDYIVNDRIVVERKTKGDFVSSLIGNRLFAQCQRLKKTSYSPIFVIEGNPYKSGHKISNEAVKGALLSISVSWQIPIVFSHNTEDTAKILIAAASQLVREGSFIRRKGNKPKAIMKKRLYLLQGLPMVGVTIANKLLERFGSIERVVLASVDELMEVDGIGKGKALKIKEFIIRNS